MNDGYEDEALGKVYDGRLMKRLLRYARPYVRLIAVGAGALLAFSALDLLPALLIRGAVDGPIRLRLAGEMEDPAFHQSLLVYAGILLGIVAVGFLVRGVHMWVVEYLGQRVMVDVRIEVFEKIQRLSLRYFDRNPVGRLVTRVVSDVEALYQVLSTGLVSVFGDMVKIIAIAAVLAFVNWGLTLWLFTLMPILFYVSVRFRNRARQAYRDVRKEIAATNSNLQESITGVRVIQIFGQEDRARRHFGELSEKLYRAHANTVFHFAWFFPAVEFFFALAQGLLIWVGAKYAVGDSLSPGDFILFWFFINLVFEPIRNLSEQYNVMQSAMASSERIFRILDTEEIVKSPEEPLRLENGDLRGEIEFDHVWFAYRGEDWVIRDLSFKVAPGESVALVGATGAGKTSIISLVSRLYDVQRGRILLDGRDVREYDVQELRRRVSVVLQDVFLFAGNILENIRLAKSEIPAEAVIRAAETVNANRFIEKLPGGYDAKVMERGATLSVGQKQLLAFARALAFDPRILILDEATSSIDTETEVLIQEALAKLLEGRTSIIIAHRLSTIQRCDRILVMHHGELKEEGTHQELLARRGIYRHLFDLQYGLTVG